MKPGIRIGGLRVWTRGDVGLFACGSGDPASRDVEGALSFWKSAGCRRAYGPVSAGAADTGGGLCVWRGGERRELLGAARTQDESALLRAGFRAAGEESAFRVPVPEIPARPGMEVRQGLTAADCACVLGEEEDAVRRALRELAPYIRKEFCFTAFDGGPAGILLCLSRGKSVRVLTLWTRPDRRNGAACVPLLRALAEAARRCGIAEIDAARVPADNPRSLGLVRALGGREIARYRLYEADIG